MTLNWAVHMLNGVSAPASSSFTVDDLVHQLEDSGAKVLFTCAPLLQSACQAATKAGMPLNSIFVFDLPVPYAGEHAFTTFEQLVTEGATLPPVPALSWEEGRGARQTAFLCYSSGTSGLPVRVVHLSTGKQANLRYRKESESRTRILLQMSCRLLKQRHQKGRRRGRGSRTSCSVFCPKVTYT